MALKILGNLKKNDAMLIVSPHLDDAVLSVGGIMERAATDGIDVVAGTIFTADADPSQTMSPIAQELYALWNLGDRPYIVRREEDVAAVASLGARHIHGGMLDAIYRNGNTGDVLYPTRASIFSGPSAKDTVGPAIRDLLSGWMRDIKPRVVLCPMAVGRHVDHIVTSEALRHADAGEGVSVFLYEDLPYSAGFFPVDFPDTVPAAIERSSWTILQPTTIPVDANSKIDAIRLYRSQLADIFPAGRDVEGELKQYMSSHDGDGWVERVWAAISKRN